MREARKIGTECMKLRSNLKRAKRAARSGFSTMPPLKMHCPVAIIAPTYVT